MAPPLAGEIGYIGLGVVIIGGAVCKFMCNRKKPSRNNCCIRKKLGRYPSGNKVCRATGIDCFLDMTWSELFAVLVMIGALLGRFLLFYEDFPEWSKGYKESGVNGKFARSIGELNFVTLAFAVYPVTRHSCFVYLMGIPFDRAVKFHRWWGRITILIMGIHGFGMYAAFRNAPEEAEGMSYALEMSINPDTNWSNGAGLLCFLCLLLLGITSSPPFRRNCWEVFQVSHWVLVILALVFGGLHMPSLLSWMLGALFLYGIDMAFRVYQNGIANAEIVSVKALPGDVTRVEIQKPKGFSYEGGQYCWLRFPEISSLQQHPFSISSGHTGVDTDPFTFHIKNMGEGTFTSELYKRAGEITMVNVEGPYGKPSIPLHSYSTIVLCCGGIGVTPCASILEEVLELWKKADQLNIETTAIRKVVFVWSVRQAETLSWFAHDDGVLARAVALNGGSDQEEGKVGVDVKQNDGKPSLNSKTQVQLHLHVTRAKAEAGQAIEGAPQIPGINPLPGRPNYGKLFQTLTEQEHDDEYIGIFACGPGPLVDSIQHVCYDNPRTHFHKETFLF